MTVMENASFAAALYGARGRGGELSSIAWGFHACAICRGSIFPPGNGAVWRSRGFCCRNAPLWLLDEPLAALDSVGKALIAELISAHCAKGGIVIAATHDPLGVAAQRLAMGAA